MSIILDVVVSFFFSFIWMILNFVIFKLLTFEVISILS